MKKIWGATIHWLGRWWLSAATILLFLALASVLPLTYACAFWWSRYDFTCVAVEIVNTWQTYVAGLLALAAAAASIAYIRLQMRQLDAQQKENFLREDTAIADALLSDVLDTCNRIKRVASITDIDPPMSELGRGLIVEAAKINPVLSIALQRHCTEIGSFEAKLREIPGGANQRLARLLEDRQELSYRAHLLSHCFGVATNQIRLNKAALGPFITDKDLAEIEAAYAVGTTKRGYMAHVFETTGIAKEVSAQGHDQAASSSSIAEKSGSAASNGGAAMTGTAPGPE